MGISRGKESCAQAGKAFAWPRNTGARRGPTAKNQPRACGAGQKHKPGARLAHRRCATCSPQARRKETDRANRFVGSRRTARCIAGDEPAGADSPAPGRRVRVLPTAGARARAQTRWLCGAFSSYLSPFPVWLLLRKSLFICRSCRDGNFLACPLPRLCSRPEGLVTCCFFADFCAHCLFSRLRCSHGFSLLFFIFSCLTSSSQTSFHLSLRPRRASTFFRKESRQRFARGRGSAPFEPPFQRPAADLPFPRAAGRLTRPFGPQTAGR